MLGIRNLGAIINDELREEFLYEAFKQIGAKETLLDVGCGTRPFKSLYDRYVDYSVGTDVPYSPHDIKNVQVISDGMSLPFADNAFDIILCTEVMEHVSEPEKLLYEFYRILKSGGSIIITTPFMVPVHEAPYDFYRYTSYGLQYLIEKAGLEVVEIRPFSGMGGVLISFIVQFQIRLWTPLSKLLKTKFLITNANPFVLVFVYLPQRLYMLMHKIFCNTAIYKKILNKTSYTTKGYGVIALKKS